MFLFYAIEGKGVCTRSRMCQEPGNRFLAGPTKPGYMISMIRVRVNCGMSTGSQAASMNKIVQFGVATCYE